MDSRTVGILGGGQLGRMLVEAANRMDITTVVLDVENAPAKQINASTQHLTGSFTDSDRIRELANRCDMLTFEIEHVNTEVLEEMDQAGRQGDRTQEQEPKYRLVDVQPSWQAIRKIQDKFLQKSHLRSHGVETTESMSLIRNDPPELARVVAEIGLPCMLKSKRQAYDGRGNYPIDTLGDIPSALAALGDGDRELYVERWASFTSELAVMVVKTVEDTPSSCSDSIFWQTATLAFPVVETVHENSICKLVYAPARNVSPDIQRRAETLARRAVASFGGKGVFGVEMFLLADDPGTLLVNEIAPRPHNSGHYTIEACSISQYEAHLRAILDLPFPPGSPQMLTPDTHAIMLNLLGGPQPDPASHLVLARQALGIPGATAHLYGKGEARPGRKMGHITIVAQSMAECERRVAPLLDTLALDRRNSDRRASITSSVVTPVAALGISPSTGQAVVGVTMGSDSDLPVLKPGLELLRELGIPFEVTITSAHRTPERMFRYAQLAVGRGIKVVIAAAGGAAHLPGMIASSTPLPVIGLPVKASTLDGMDSLLSIVQMPRGVPVATVSINNSINAALLAARILGISDGQIQSRLVAYARDMERDVMDKVARWDEQGWERYGKDP
ncbi:MAG: hypothetical protein M1823_001971 [Watsoniomyces obsoletus]|nr:MAG: hypothetical protein M1823_001971 [Watsoniomyces obsoletus]